MTTAAQEYRAKVKLLEDDYRAKVKLLDKDYQAKVKVKAKVKAQEGAT